MSTLKDFLDNYELDAAYKISCFSEEQANAIVAARPELIDDMNDFVYDLSENENYEDYEFKNILGIILGVELSSLLDLDDLDGLDIDFDTLCSCFEITSIDVYKGNIVFNCDYIGLRSLHWSDTGRIIFTRS